MSEQYTKAADASLQLAIKEAKRLKHDCVGSEHLLLGILEEGDNVAAKVLESNGVQKERIANLIENSIAGSGTVATKHRFQYTVMYNRVMEQSETEAIRTQSEKIGTEHFLLAMIKIPECLSLIHI